MDRTPVPERNGPPRLLSPSILTGAQDLLGALQGRPGRIVDIELEEDGGPAAAVCRECVGRSGG